MRSIKNIEGIVSQSVIFSLFMLSSWRLFSQPSDHVRHTGCNGFYLCSELVPLRQITTGIADVTIMDYHVNILQILN
jgi:hypothetical protein